MVWSLRTCGTWGVAAVALAALSGCSSSAGACAAVRATLPATAVAGTTVTVSLSELWASCNDTGDGPPAPLKAVRIDAVWSADRGVVVASASAPVTDGGTAEAHLPVPSGTTGELEIKVGEQTVAHIAVGRG
jgi:hypothetical protein